MAFDECPPSRADARRTSRRRWSARWLGRALTAAHARPDQALFGIVQGGTYPDLRAAVRREIVALDFPGFAIGGFASARPGAMLAVLEARRRACRRTSRAT